ncbi:hypothetical protein PYCC9005_004676 [Savitreella phatthalungensis]
MSWSLLTRAEGFLDRVLDDGGTPDPTAAAASTSASASPVKPRGSSEAARPSTRTDAGTANGPVRLSLAERLARATAVKTSSTVSSTSRPASPAVPIPAPAPPPVASTSTVTPELTELQRSAVFPCNMPHVLPDQSQIHNEPLPAPSTPPPAHAGTIPRDTTPPDAAGTIAQLQADLQACEKRRVDELHTAAERISSLEGKLSYYTAAKEADARLASISGSVDGVRAELEGRIAGLVREGEALAKREGEALEAARKHKARCGELESLIGASLKAVEKSEGTQSQLKKELAAAREARTAAERKARQLERIESHAQDLTKSKADLQGKLTEAERKLRDTARSASQATSLATQLDTHKDRLAKLEARVQELLSDAKATAEENALELSAVQAKLDRAVERGAQADREHAVEVGRLESQLESVRARLEDSSTGSDAQGTTRLLRQIETLQHDHAASAANLQLIERALERRAIDAETDRDRLTAIEESLRKRVREDAKRLANLDEALAHQTTLTDTAGRELADLREQLATAVAGADGARQALADATAAWETERRERAAAAAAAVVSREDVSVGSPKVSSPAAGYFGFVHRRPPRQSRHPSTSPSFISSADDDNDDDNFSEGTRTQVNHRHSRRPSLASPSAVAVGEVGSGNVGLLERLAGQVRRLEGELLLEREEKVRVCGQRDDARAMLVEMDGLRKQADKVDQLEGEMKKLQERFEKTLELLGQQTEENDQLKEDISDMKQAYRLDMDKRFT